MILVASDLPKDRLDTLVVRSGILSSREQAARYILAGRIRVDGVVVDKPGKSVSIRASIELQPPEYQFVSRAGDKLAAALDEFNISCANLAVMDVGASTGGFTDCLLQRGAQRVYAIDVGYGQLDWHLRTHPRVVVMDRVNVRHLQPEDIPESPSLAVIDVSFISLRLVLPVVLSILQQEAKIVALFKPQFEVGKGQVGKGGIVRDEWLRQQVLGGFLTFTQELGLSLVGVLDSPILGKKGNKEVLVGLKKGGFYSETNLPG